MKRLFIILALMVCMLPVFAETITPIANIQDSTTAYNNHTVTVSGTITIGASKLSTSQLKAYIQDNSGRGIMLFDYNLTAAHSQNFLRGNVVKVTGNVTEYNGVTELTSLTNVEVIDLGAQLPVIPLTLSAAANYQYYEGTYVKLSGTLTENPYIVGGGANITIKDENNTTMVCRVWDTTNINYTMLTAGIPIDAYGVVSPYNSASQILPAYQQDIVIKLTDPVISDISISPASPYVDQQIMISAKIRDYNGTINRAKISFRTDNQVSFIDSLMHAGSNSTYTITLPAFNTLASDEGNYFFKIHAIDNDSITVESTLQRITVIKHRPIISNIHFTNSPEVGDSLIVQATIVDQDGTVTDARLLYSLNYNNSEHELSMNSLGSNVYEAVIPGQKAGTVVNVKIWAQDDSSLVSINEEFSEGVPARYVYPVKAHKAILKITPKVYDIYNGDAIEIGYFGQIGDKAIIRIYNAEGKLICTPVNEILSVASGINFYTWNGKDSNSQLLDPGLYICHLEMTQVSNGNKKVEQAPIVIGMKLK